MLYYHEVGGGHFPKESQFVKDQRVEVFTVNMMNFYYFSMPLKSGKWSKFTKFQMVEMS